MDTAVLFVFMWATFVLMAVLEVRRRSPALLFVGAAIVSAGLPISVFLFTDRFDQPVVERAVLFICVFNLLYLLTRFLLRGSPVVDGRLRDPEEPLSPRARRFLTVIGIIFISPFVLKLAQAGFSLAVLGEMTWAEGGGLLNLLTTYGAHVSFGLVLCLFVLRRFALAAVALLAVILLVFVDRSRALGIAAVAPLLLFLVFWSIEERISPLRLGATVGLALLAVATFFLVQQVRYLGPLVAVATAEPDLVAEAALGRAMSLEADLGLVEGLIWLMTNGHQVTGYGEAVTLKRMMIFWLPGSLKPPEFTHSIATAMQGGLTGASVHPTIYGLTWGDAGWLGLAYAVPLAAVLRLMDRIVIAFGRDLAWTILLGPYSVFCLLAARGSLYNGWVVLVVATVGLLALIRLVSMDRAHSFVAGNASAASTE